MAVLWLIKLMCMCMKHRTFFYFFFYLPAYSGVSNMVKYIYIYYINNINNSITLRFKKKNQEKKTKKHQTIFSPVETGFHWLIKLKKTPEPEKIRKLGKKSSSEGFRDLQERIHLVRLSDPLFFERNHIKSFSLPCFSFLSWKGFQKKKKHPIEAFGFPFSVVYSYTFSTFFLPFTFRS